MKSFRTLTTLTLGGIIATTQLATAQTPNAATDTRIDPQVRSFLAELNKDSSPFWELPQPKPQEILTALQNKSGAQISRLTYASKGSCVTCSRAKASS
jgi:acetyl esterase